MRKRKRATIGVPKYDDGGKRAGVTKGRKRRRIRELDGRQKRGCLMPRIITAFNLERPRVPLFLSLDDIRATSKAAKGWRRLTAAGSALQEGHSVFSNASGVPSDSTGVAWTPRVARYCLLSDQVRTNEAPAVANPFDILRLFVSSMIGERWLQDGKGGCLGFAERLPRASTFNGPATRLNRRHLTSILPVSRKN